MAWNGSGTFSRTNGTHTGSTTWVQDRTAGDYILASRHDTHDEDLATGINACLTKNGETKPTADFKPNADGTLDLGSSALTWAELHVQRVIPYGSTVPANGMYLPAANTVGFAANSVKLATVGVTAATGLDGFSVFADGANGANIELVGDGATTPKKYIRAKSGTLDFLNDAYGEVIAYLTDGGNWLVDGSLTAGGTASSIPMPAFALDPVTVNTGYTADTLAVNKDAFGIVHCTGIAYKDAGASGALLYFTLAAGYRPQQAVRRIIYNGTDGAVLCLIGTDGTVTVTHATSNNGNTNFDFSFPTT